MKRAYTYLLGGFAYISGIGLTISSAWLITMASFQPPLQTLSIAIVGVRFFGISRSVARYAERLASHQTVFGQLTGLRVRLFESISSRPLEVIRDLGSGSLVKRLVDDVERVQEYELRITLPQIAALISVSSGVALGGWIRPESLLITVPISIILLFAVPRSVKSRCELVARDIEVAEGEYSSLIQQAAHGVIEAKLYGYLDQKLQETSAIESRILTLEKKLISVNAVFQFCLIGLVGFSLVSLSIMANVLSPKIPAVQVTILIFLSLVIFEAVIAWYPNLFGAGKMLLARKEISAIENRTEGHSVATISSNGKFSELQVKDVCVSWGCSFRTEPLTFSLKAGESLCIRGRSGVGKSTFALGMLGLLKYEGHILIDGVELCSVDNPSSKIVGSIQNSHIFNTSIRENLKIAAPNASDDALLRVLSLVELDALVRNMPEGLDTFLGELGRTLSGGEAKRLSLARVLLSDADIVILDEPTEHLDDALAARIESEVLQLNRTIIVITHSGWNNCTRSIVMNR